MGLGTGFAHEKVPDALREAAAELGFPLFEVPYEVPFIAVTEKAASHLVNEHYAVLQRALSARTSGWSGSCCPRRGSTAWPRRWPR